MIIKYLKKAAAVITAAAMAVSAVPYAYAESGVLPRKYDLRSLGYVTPVKEQSPWSTCWGFAAIAAAETSILSKLGKSYNEYPIDLSELQLAWFCQTPVQDNYFGQKGEGMYSVDGESAFGSTGCGYFATSLFGTGVGPVPEQLIPYTGTDSSGKASKSLSADWSVPEDYRQYFTYELMNTFILGTTAGRDSQGRYKFDAVSFANIKNQLYKGRGVSVSIHADNYYPGSSMKYPRYINTETWAHYTYNDAPANHAVTIVGWDDDYSRENFLSKVYSEKEQKYIDVAQPPANGAWIVKNSWGDSEWGVDGSGYFYVSYYDRSVSCFESFDFKVTGNADYQAVLCYDMLPARELFDVCSPKEVLISNIFDVDEDAMLDAVAVDTAAANSVVKAEIYLLNKDAKTPTDGKLIAETEYAIKLGGFHKMYLERSVKVPKDSRISIVTTITTDNGKVYHIPLKLNTNQAGAKYTGEEYYTKAVINFGCGMICQGGKWQDWAMASKQFELMRSRKNGVSYSIVCVDDLPIKAYLSPAQ